MIDKYSKDLIIAHVEMLFIYTVSLWNLSVVFNKTELYKNASTYGLFGTSTPLPT